MHDSCAAGPEDEESGVMKEDEEEDMECSPCRAGGEDLEAEEEGAFHRKVPDPGQPSKADREQHELTHIPFRSWCVHCVRGRGQSDHHAHRKNPR